MSCCGDGSSCANAHAAIVKPTASTKYAASLLVIMQQRENFHAFKFLAAVEEVQFHHKREPGDFRALRLGELHAGVGCASGGEQVVYDDYALAALDGVFVELEGIESVFQFITPFDRLGRELARLANGNKAGIQTVGQRRTKNESASFNGQHGVNSGIQVVLGESIN